jgi:hypothetical protein
MLRGRGRVAHRRPRPQGTGATRQPHVTCGWLFSIVKSAQTWRCVASQNCATCTTLGCRCVCAIWRRVSAGSVRQIAQTIQSISFVQNAQYKLFNSFVILHKHTKSLLKKQRTRTNVLVPNYITVWDFCQ